MPLVFLASIDAAEIGTIGQALLAGKPKVFLDPPEQIRARVSGLAPNVEAKEISIRQAQHARLQTGRQHRFA